MQFERLAIPKLGSLEMLSILCGSHRDRRITVPHAADGHQFQPVAAAAVGDDGRRGP